MSNGILCEICRSRPAKHKCPICGRRVCDEDWDNVKGVCILCSSTLCQVCGKRLAVAACARCGRLVCEECSVQISPVIRLCINCYRELDGKWPPSELVSREISKLANIIKGLLSVPRPK
jgi:hypothetical protein